MHLHVIALWELLPSNGGQCWVAWDFHAHSPSRYAAAAILISTFALKDIHNTHSPFLPGFQAAYFGWKYCGRSMIVAAGILDPLM